jgi:hypothetical protein
MATSDSTVGLFFLALTPEERSQLLTLLEQTDRKKLVEIHRTDDRAYRDFVVHQEAVLEALIAKVRGAHAPTEE